jgi:hypothetical protein
LLAQYCCQHEQHCGSSAATNQHLTTAPGVNWGCGDTTSLVASGAYMHQPHWVHTHEQ